MSGFGVGFKSLAVCALLAALAAPAAAQSGSSGVTLKSHITLAAFGSSSGNDCWGYVSPSGREYALAGLNNKVAVVEITTPSSPVIVASIPHTSSTWGSIKVYGTTAYAVTESTTGIQVIDLSQVDSGIVTLVTTLPSPGRNHNIIIDTTAGLLYTCGSRNGAGTTECFSLANPLAPVKVGPASMTTNYQHDGLPYTYTSGPLAGKTYWFGFSEGRGVDIYDFTDKNNPLLVKRATYPNMGYCHQGWLSDDKKYLYVDDEFDESNLNVPTRSLIFNVEDPLNAFFVGTFSSFLAAIDHNQYVSDGFTFQANYRSGLQIFDVGQTPEAPERVGWYDTYLANDLRGYDGAWSSYPFFPSGTVLISDINGGLFVFDPTEATTRHKPAADVATPAGAIASGNLNSLALSDNDSLQVNESTVKPDHYPIHIVTGATAYDTKPNKLVLTIESRANVAGFKQRVELKNWVTGQFEPIDERLIGTADGSVVLVVPGDITRFVNQTTRRIESRLRYSADAKSIPRLTVWVDQIEFAITR